MILDGLLKQLAHGDAEDGQDVFQSKFIVHVQGFDAAVGGEDVSGLNGRMGGSRRLDRTLR